MIPVSQGKPYAGNPHVRFEEGASAQAAPRRSALLHTRNRQSDRNASDGRGDPTAEALRYKQVSRSASEPLPLSPVNSKTPCGQRVIEREAEKKLRIRFAARKAWRGIEGRNRRASGARDLSEPSRSESEAERVKIMPAGCPQTAGRASRSA